MMRPVRNRISYANVMSTLALFVALGGVSYAAVQLPAGAVGPSELRKAAVESRHIRDGSVRLRDIDHRELCLALTSPGKSVRACQRAIEQMARTRRHPASDDGTGIHDTTRLGGSQGAPGIKGDPGAVGPGGPAGQQGIEGPIGPQGEAGATGPQGRVGLKGETGATGLDGPAGPDGPKGETGADGPAGPSGADGAVGADGPVGPIGPQGPPASPNVQAESAGMERSNAATYAFGGAIRAAIGQQPTLAATPDAGAGIVEVFSGNGERSAQLTHYAYGSAFITKGASSHLFEMFLGDRPSDVNPPELSVRHNGSHLGARIQARDSSDVTGLALDMTDRNRPRLMISDDAGLIPGAALAVENREPDGSVVLATRDPDGGVADRVIVHADGRVSIPGQALIGASPLTPVRFHGTSASGTQGQDPGQLGAVTQADVADQVRLARLLNETRSAVNSLRTSLLAHGLIG